MNYDKDLADFLASIKTLAIVGLSDDPSRDSHEVGSYLQSQGYRVIPVNPNVTTVLGRPAVAALSDIAEPVDLVVVFRKPEHAATVVDEAVEIGSRGVWLQLGIAAPEAEARARAKGLMVVSNRCVMVEHRRLLASAQI
ncbi:MAG: CoA-binding protein [Firmicutes bacterium]|nr:CoA-binding protein [Bacillota bacterium]